MMITRNFIGVLALCLCALAACTSSKESKKTLTVLSWNVWHGGHSKTYSGKGCEGTIDILKKSEADVVLMIETYGAAPMVCLLYTSDAACLVGSEMCIRDRFIAVIPLFGNMLLPTA